MKVTYLGHSCFEIETQKGKILIDPFLVKVPNYKPQNISDIFVTHGHSDHLGSAIEISRSYDSKITAIFELANYCCQKGANANGIGLGSWIEYPWGKVIAVPAFHSSSSVEGLYTGNPCGFIFKIDGKSFYHAGDTCLNSEMKVIGELYDLDFAMLPIGGHFTMDVDHAMVAARWINAPVIIPMHYNTFDAIKIDIEEFKNESRKANIESLVLDIGQTMDL